MTRIDLDEDGAVESLVAGRRAYWEAFVAANPDDVIYGFFAREFAPRHGRFA